MAPALNPKSAAQGGKPRAATLPVTGRRAIRPGRRSSELTPDSRTPSTIELPDDAADTPIAARSEAYGRGLDLDTDISGRELGTFLHRYFEVLGTKPGLATKLAEIEGVNIPRPALSAIEHSVRGIETWLSETLGAASVLRDWPLLALDSHGSVVSGTADVVAECAQGVWIIDHKSDRIDDPVEALREYSRQLDAYAEAMQAQGSRVLGVGVNWTRRNEVCWKLPASSG